MVLHPNNISLEFNLPENYHLSIILGLSTKHFNNLADDIADKLYIYETIYQNLFKQAFSNGEPFNFDLLAEKIDLILNEHKSQFNINLQKAINEFYATLASSS